MRINSTSLCLRFFSLVVRFVLKTVTYSPVTQMVMLLPSVKSFLVVVSYVSINPLVWAKSFF